MKTKLIISISLIFLLFNSCKKQAQLIFKSRFYGNVYNQYTNKPISGLKVYATKMDRYIYTQALNNGGKFYSNLDVFDSTTTDQNGYYEFKFKKKIEYHYSVGIKNNEGLYFYNIRSETKVNKHNTKQNTNLYLLPNLPCKIVFLNPNKKTLLRITVNFRPFYTDVQKLIASSEQIISYYIKDNEPKKGWIFPNQYKKYISNDQGKPAAWPLFWPLQIEEIDFSIVNDTITYQIKI